ncbi:MAG: hypothetical protein KF718_28765 [Polyangiaceae bacterium]|nr:hypothetical protein [Polyangiaceae bacterium]
MKLRILVLVCLVLSLAACGSDSEPTPAAKTGQVELRFAISNGARQNSALVDALTGTVYGAIYKKADVSLTGPSAEAQDLASVELPGVDLTDPSAASSVASWASGPLPTADELVFLGFFDVDGNGSASREPDEGDPVTLPLSNAFTPVADQTIAVTAIFELVLN